MENHFKPGGGTFIASGPPGNFWPGKNGENNYKPRTWRYFKIARFYFDKLAQSTDPNDKLAAAICIADIISHEECYYDIYDNYLGLGDDENKTVEAEFNSHIFYGMSRNNDWQQTFDNVRTYLKEYRSFMNLPTRLPDDIFSKNYPNFAKSADKAEDKRKHNLDYDGKWKKGKDGKYYKTT